MLRLAAVDGFHIFLNNKVKDSLKVSYFKGGGGLGVQAYRFGIKDFDLGVERKASTRPDILRVVLGPASEQTLGLKPKYELKEIELSYCHHSICLQKTSNYKNNVKIG